MKPITAIAISGGIDSLAAAHLLKSQGHALIGIHFLTGFESAVPNPNEAFDPFQTAKRKLSAVTAQLNIPIKILDCRDQFKTCVVDYFIRTYRSGQTPNPCLICNPAIKFGTVLGAAQRLGADRLATGHYARTYKDETGRFRLLKGRDPLKDQSYFLAMLDQCRLESAVFPLGDMTKKEVIEHARTNGLRPIEKNESQDICFIKGGSYGDFLMTLENFQPAPGPITDINGRYLGMHPGLHLFTVGQRRGINCPAPQPYYVLRLDTANNRLVVGVKSDLLSSECRVKDINWIISPPQTPFRARTRLRYRHREAESLVIPEGDHSAIVRFDVSQEAITPGQGAVFYVNNEVFGGGRISAEHENPL